jgi:hypothetical protein
MVPECAPVTVFVHVPAAEASHAQGPPGGKDRHLAHRVGVLGEGGDQVLGLVSWLQLSAQLTLVAAELNVVRARRLWPRSIVQPPLVEADRRAPRCPERRY